MATDKFFIDGEPVGSGTLKIHPVLSKRTSTERNFISKAIYDGKIFIGEEMEEFNKSLDSLIKENYSTLMQKMKDVEEKLIKDVLRQLLKREPVLEDAKRLTRMVNPAWDEKYFLAFDDIVIGKVETIDYGPEWKIKFTPTRDYDSGNRPKNYDHDKLK